MAYIGRSGARRGYPYYDSDGGQHHSRGAFLLLASDRSNRLWGCVRRVALSQCGHFMMGVARVGGQRIVVSGAYGSDGLPLDWEELTPRAQEEFTPVPPDVAGAYWYADTFTPHPSSLGPRMIAEWAIRELRLPGERRGGNGR